MKGGWGVIELHSGDAWGQRFLCHWKEKEGDLEQHSCALFFYQMTLCLAGSLKWLVKMQKTPLLIYEANLLTAPRWSRTVVVGELECLLTVYCPALTMHLHCMP